MEGITISNFNDSSVVSGTNANDSISNYGSSSTIRALGGADTVINFGSYSIIDGGVGNDSIGNEEASYVSISAGLGNDYILNDHAYYPTIEGGNGNDQIIIQRGHHTYIDGGAGNDTILGQIVENDWAMGGYANIIGGSGDDYIDPVFSDSASIFGGDGNDTITNEGNNATLNGGVGDDVISLRGSSISGSVIEYSVGDGNDFIFGFNETVTLSLASGTRYSTVENGDNVIVSVGENNITISGAKNLSSLNIINYETPALDITGNVNDTLISGTSGADKIINNASNVTINGLGGNDSITNNGEYGIIDGGAGQDSINNNAANVTINGAEGDDNIYNSASNVSISGSYGNDTIANSGSNVTINSGSGFDSISISGDNVLIEYPGGRDTITGFNSTSTLQIGNGSADYEVFEGLKNILVFTDEDYVILENALLHNDSININGNAVEVSEKVIHLVTGGDSVSASRSNINIAGNTGKDTIISSGENVTIDGGANNDRIENYNSKSIVFGGDGSDTILAAKGSSIQAGAGYDIIRLFETDDNSSTMISVSGGGKTTVENFQTGFDENNDRIFAKYDESIALKFDGTNVSIKNDNDGTLNIFSNVANDAQFVNLLADDEKTLNKVALAKQNAVITVENELPNVYIGNNSGVDFTNYNDSLNIQLGYDSGETSSDTLTFLGISQVTAGGGQSNLIGNDKNNTLTAGTGSTSLSGGKGNDKLIGNGGNNKFYFYAGDGRDTISNFEFVSESSTTADKINTGSSVNTFRRSGDNVVMLLDQNSYLTLENAVGKNFYLNDKIVKVDNNVVYDGIANYYYAGSSSTLKVDANVTSAEIWLDNSHETQFNGKIRGLDASEVSGNTFLVGNQYNNTIIASQGNSTLWGGSSSTDDLLIGNSSQNTFLYNYGNGKDKIQNTSDGDSILLSDISLDQIISTKIYSDSVFVRFNDGGTLRVAGSSDVTFTLADGANYSANHQTSSWQNK